MFLSVVPGQPIERAAVGVGPRRLVSSSVDHRRSGSTSAAPVTRRGPSSVSHRSHSCSSRTRVACTGSAMANLSARGRSAPDHRTSSDEYLILQVSIGGRQSTQVADAMHPLARPSHDPAQPNRNRMLYVFTRTPQHDPVKIDLSRPLARKLVSADSGNPKLHRSAENFATADVELCEPDLYQELAGQSLARQIVPPRVQLPGATVICERG